MWSDGEYKVDRKGGLEFKEGLVYEGKFCFLKRKFMVFCVLRIGKSLKGDLENNESMKDKLVIFLLLYLILLLGIFLIYLDG